MQEVKVDTFEPRWYQRDLINALEYEGKKKFVIVWPRRAGKDVAALNLMLRQAFKRVGVYYYLYPKYDQCRRAVWDSILSTGERFLDFIPARLIAKKNNVEMKIVLVNGSIIQFNGADNADCYDAETEILTDNGWMLFQELIDRKFENIKVATLKDGCMVYEKPLDYIKQSYSGPMYSIKNKAMDMLVTPNHKFYVKSPKGAYKFKRISDPTIKYYSIPSMCDWKGKKQSSFTFPGTDITISMMDYMALLGIYLSEGSSSYRQSEGYEVSIAQKKFHTRAKIEELLDRCGIKYSKRDDRYVFYSKDMYNYFSQFGKQPDRFIPRDVLKYDKIYLEELFTWLVLGDGTIHKNGSIYYYSCSKQLIDDVQELILKIGYSGYVKIKSKAGSSGGLIRGREIISNHDLYSIRVRKSKFKRFCSSKANYIQMEDYCGNVYCITVPSGVIKVRRNGKECWSGNSLRGTNPVGVVFSEYSRVNHPDAYNGVVAPILAANSGWVVFISTPNGHNEFYNVYKYATSGDDEEWYAKILTIDETKHVSEKVLAKEKGRMSDELFLQEYFCFPANTGILTPNGVTMINQIQADDIVVSHSGRFRRVLGVIDRPYTGKMIEISSYGSYENIICTPNHPIQIYNQSTQSYSWVPAANIKYGDRVVFPKRNISNESVISYNLCMLMAWYITEGSSFKNGLQFTVGNENEKSRVIDLLKSLGYSYKIQRGETAITITVNSVYLVDFFKSNCGSISYNKHIPMTLIIGHEKSFFHELIEGDGCFSVHNGYKKFCYTTTSKQLAYQVQLLANSLNLGYAAGITRRRSTTSIIEGRIVKCKESYCVNIGYLKPRFKSNLLRAKNCIAALVKNVRSFDYDGNVYNLKVQYDESYIANGRAVHNCSFEVANTGAYYAKYVQQAYADRRIGYVPHDSSHEVYTAWDLGYHSPSVIIFYQVIGRKICVIDHYHKSNQDLSHYVSLLRSYSESKGYVYGNHFFPHDAKKHELGSGETRLQILEQLGLKITVLDRTFLNDGIEVVKHSFKRIFFDEKNCSLLLDALEAYSRKWDPVTKRFINKDKVDWTNDHCDCLRYVCQSLSYIDSNERSPEEFDKKCKEIMYGSNTNLPPIFRDSEY